MTEKIDFVITWVDGNDPAWREERDHYAEVEHRAIDNSNVRYRDWETLMYWFRGVEKFAPWVNRVFFVTWGHVPAWLDTNNPKLQIVKHEDFIPAEYLPTYNSNVIEFYFHKIKGLSEHFVYFNDDMLILDDLTPAMFFRNGLPCDTGGMRSSNHKGMFGASIYLAITLINEHFNKRKVIRKHPFKWFNFSYPYYIICNLLFLFISGDFFPGFIAHHIPYGYLKETYDDVWAHCEKDLKRTSANRFRSYGDIAFWLIRYWQLASGKFHPYNIIKNGRYYAIDERTLSEITDCIRGQKARLLCLNDYEETKNYEEAKSKILDAFNSILPEKSSFELMHE